MFKALEEMLKSFFQTVGELIAYVFGLIDDTVYVIKLLGKVIIRLPDLFSWLPSQIVALLLLTITVVVLYKVLGREG